MNWDRVTSGDCKGSTAHYYALMLYPFVILSDNEGSMRAVEGP